MEKQTKHCGVSCYVVAALRIRCKVIDRVFFLKVHRVSIPASRQRNFQCGKKCSHLLMESMKRDKNAGESELGGEGKCFFFLEQVSFVWGKLGRFSMKLLWWEKKWSQLRGRGHLHRWGNRFSNKMHLSQWGINFQRQQTINFCRAVIFLCLLNKWYVECIVNDVLCAL